RKTCPVGKAYFASDRPPSDRRLFASTLSRSRFADNSGRRVFIARKGLYRGFTRDYKSHAQLDSKFVAAGVSGKIRFRGSALHAAQVSRIVGPQSPLSDEPGDLRLQDP